MRDLGFPEERGQREFSEEKENGFECLKFWCPEEKNMKQELEYIPSIFKKMKSEMKSKPEMKPSRRRRGTHSDEDEEGIDRRRRRICWRR